MDGGNVTPSKTYKNNTEVFEEMFAHYLSLGMSYELYWEGDPWATRHYQKAFDLQRENRNYDAWWNGYYTFVAISTALANIHLDGKSHQPVEYMKQPVRITAMTEEELAAEQERQEREIIDRLNALKANWDRNHTGGQNGNG